MKTSALLKLHQRQVDLLDMIIKAGNKKQSFEADKRLYESYNSWVYKRVIKDHEAMINKYKAIKQRLISYYKDIQVRIMTLQPTIELNTTTEMDMATTLS